MTSVVLLGDHPLVITCADQLGAAGVDIAAVSTSDPAVAAWAATNGHNQIAWSDLGEAAAGADVLLSIGNLRIIPDEVLEAVELAVNFHDGPLPELAGLHAPMWAILRGRRDHGVTWHVIEGGIDEGDILAERRFPLAPDETTRSLNLKCLTAGADGFADVVPQIVSGQLQRAKQPRPHDEYHGRWDRPLVANLVDVAASSPAELDRIVRALDFGSTINRVGRALVDLGSGVMVVDRVDAGSAVAAARPGTIASAAVVGDEIDIEVGTADGNCRLRGPATHTGAVEELVGRTLPVPTSDTLADAHARSVRSEAAWARDLADSADPTNIAIGANPQESDRVVGRPVELGTASWSEAVAVVSAYLLRRSGQSVARLDVPIDDLGCPAFAQYGPLIVEVGSDSAAQAIHQLDEAIERHRRRGPLPVDLLLRRPQQVSGAPVIPPSTVRVVADPDGVADAGLGLVIDPSGSSCSFVTSDVALEVRLREGLLAFVTALSGDADVSLPNLPAMGPAELDVVAAPISVATSPTGSLIDRFSAVVGTTPDAPAVAHGPQAWTYGELDAAARTVAAHLIDAGVTTGDLVGLSAAPSCDAVAGLLGVLMAGAAYVPLDPRFPAERLDHMVADAGLAVVLVDDSSPVQGVPRTLQLRQVVTAGSTEPVPEPVPVTAADVAYVMYTSGSTGKPKGVMVEHGNVIGFLEAMEPITGTEAGTWLSVTTLSFDISVLELFQPLVNGWKVVLYEGLAAAVDGGGAGPGPGIDLSLFFFGSGQDSDYRLLLDVARFGDTEGFAAIWTPERHFHDFGGPYPNPAVTSAAVAAVTDSIGIRAGSCVLPLHHPVRVAEEWAVVDRMSDGRVGLSVAAGWHPDDFVLRPEGYGLSKDELAEQIELLQRLWRGEAAPFPGPKGTVEVSTLPRPVQDRLPIWYTTAGNPASFEFAGRHGLNLLTHLLGQSLDQVATNVERYRAAWTEAGHEGEGSVVLMLHTYVAGSRAEARAVVREPMKAYLRDSVGLLRDVASSFPTFDADADADDALAGLSAADLDALLEAGFERYFETSGLFGSVDDARAFAAAVAAADVDEIACLCDFGVENDLVRESLPKLARLRRQLEANDAPDTYASLIRDHAVTHMQCTPSEARIVLADPASGPALGELHTMLVGGEALPVEVAGQLTDALEGPLVNMYGPTETTIWSVAHRVTRCDVDAATIPIGQPLTNTICRVVDDAGEVRPIGHIGELLIGGHGVTRGYHGQPERTAERFLDTADGRMYRTGDLAAVRVDGSLTFHGRIDNQVKIRGHRVELGDIETALAAHPAVSQAIVTFAAEPGREPVLAAHLVASGGDPMAADGVVAAVAPALPAHMVPATAQWWDELPVTPNGKVDRLRLGVAPVAVVASAPAPNAEVPSPAASAAVGRLGAGDVGDLVADVWREVLHVDAIDRTRSFFDHGGNSLQIISVRQKLEERLEQPVALVDLFRHATVKDLATAFGRSEAPAAKSAADLTAVGAPPDIPTGLNDRAARRAAVRRERRRG